MLSNKKIVCPNNLIAIAKKSGIINAAIVNAGEIFPMESVHKAVQHNLINPIFIGNENEIKKYAEKLSWDISKYEIINEKNVSEELKNLEGLNNKMLALLAKNNIISLDDFADLSNYDLLDSKEGIFRSLGLNETAVNNMIMKAREKWFTDEKES